MKIVIYETLKKVVDVDAKNRYEGLNKVKRMYALSEVVLTADDFDSVRFTVEEE